MPEIRRSKTVPLMEPENSFRHLQRKAPLLLLPDPQVLTEAVRIIYKWLPGCSAELIEQDGLILIMAIGLNSFQVLELLELGIEICYLDHELAFIPWNHRCQSSPGSGTVLRPDGSSFLLRRDQARSMMDFIYFRPPELEWLGGPSSPRPDLPFRLRPEQTPGPRAFLFDITALADLLSLFNLHLPLADFSQAHGEFSFLFARQPDSELILIQYQSESRTAPAGESGELLEALSAQARLSFWPFFQNSILLQSGRNLTPRPVFKVLRENFNLSSLNLVREDPQAPGIPLCLEWNVGPARNPISDLPGLLTRLNSAALKRFMNLSNRNYQFPAPKSESTAAPGRKKTPRRNT